MKRSWFAYPYSLWMVIFTIAPMIFEELFILQTGILAVRAKSAAGEGIAFDPEGAR